MDEGGTNVRVARDLRPEDALRWLERAEGGATLLLVTRARGAGVRCTPAADAADRMRAACAAALAAGATRALLWQAEGDVPPGRAVAVLAAAGERRRDARRALDLLTEGLTGVAERTELVP